MKKNDKEYKEIHKLCFGNREILEKTNKCVCIDCCRKFEFNEIYEWVFYFDRKDTALCPYCSIDSVIPLIINGIELTDKDIDIMSRYYFGEY